KAITNIPRFRDLLQYNGLASIMYKHVGYRVGVAERERESDDAHGYIRFSDRSKVMLLLCCKVMSQSTFLSTLAPHKYRNLNVLIRFQGGVVKVLISSDLFCYACSQSHRISA